MTSLLFVVSAPSGAGKTTIVRRLVESNPRIRVAVSHTTRTARKHERHGRDYFFVEDKEFDAIRDSGGFLEHAEVFGNRYGTSRREVDEKQASGRPVILEIDWQGAGQVRRAMPEAQTVFLLPPSREELVKRLEGRNSDRAAVVARRLAEARDDIGQWRDFHYVLINDDLDRTCRQMALVLEGRGEEYSVTDPRRRACVAELIASGGWEEEAPQPWRGIPDPG